MTFLEYQEAVKQLLEWMDSFTKKIQPLIARPAIANHGIDYDTLKDSCGASEAIIYIEDRLHQLASEYYSQFNRK